MGNLSAEQNLLASMLVGGKKTALKRGAREDARVNVRYKSINLCSRIVDTSDMLY